MDADDERREVQREEYRSDRMMGRYDDGPAGPDPDDLVADLAGFTNDEVAEALIHFGFAFDEDGVTDAVRFLTAEAAMADAVGLDREQVRAGIAVLADEIRAMQTPEPRGPRKIGRQPWVDAGNGVARSKASVTREERDAADGYADDAHHNAEAGR